MFYECAFGKHFRIKSEIIFPSEIISEMRFSFPKFFWSIIHIQDLQKKNWKSQKLLFTYKFNLKINILLGFFLDWFNIWKFWKSLNRLLFYFWDNSFISSKNEQRKFENNNLPLSNIYVQMGLNFCYLSPYLSLLTSKYWLKKI